jgi:hypothetical protein
MSATPGRLHALPAGTMDGSEGPSCQAVRGFVLHGPLVIASA